MNWDIGWCVKTIAVCVCVCVCTYQCFFYRQTKVTRGCLKLTCFFSRFLLIRGVQIIQYSSIALQICLCTYVSVQICLKAGMRHAAGALPSTTLLVQYVAFEQ